MPSGEDMARHVLAQAQDIGVTQACPECVIGAPNVFCGVCLGVGTVTNQRLSRYLADQQRPARGQS